MLNPKSQGIFHYVSTGHVKRTFIESRCEPKKSAVTAWGSSWLPAMCCCLRRTVEQIQLIEALVKENSVGKTILNHQFGNNNVVPSTLMSYHPLASFNGHLWYIMWVMQL